MKKNISQLILMIKLQYLKVFQFTLIPVAWSEINWHNLLFHFREKKRFSNMLTNVSILITEKTNVPSVKFLSFW